MALDFLRMVLRFYKERTINIGSHIFMRGNVADRLQTENSPKTFYCLGAAYDYVLILVLLYTFQIALA